MCVQRWRKKNNWDKICKWIFCLRDIEMIRVSLQKHQLSMRSLTEYSKVLKLGIYTNSRNLNSVHWRTSWKREIEVLPSNCIQHTELNWKCDVRQQTKRKAISQFISKKKWPSISSDTITHDKVLFLFFPTFVCHSHATHSTAKVKKTKLNIF